MPAAVDEPTVMVIVEDPEPGAGIEDGLKLTVVPAGWPDALSAIAALKPPETLVLIELLPLPPCATVTAVGEAEMVKLGVAPEVTVSDTLAVCVSPPPVPVTVMV